MLVNDMWLSQTDRQTSMTPMTPPAQKTAAQPVAPDADGPLAKPHERRYITRVGPDGGTGWNVFLRRSGLNFRKRFSDTKYGGEDGAMAAAQAWRDTKDRLHPAMSKQQVAASRKRPVSGQQGVYRLVIRQRRQDGSLSVGCFWDAVSPSWHVPLRRRRFSVAKYGEDEAFRRAVAARGAFAAEAETAGQQPFRPDQPASKPATLRNIHRLDYRRDAERAWSVIIKRATLATPVNRRFSDQAYGGEAAALAAAQAWRDEMERQHPRLDRKARAARPTKASTSGVKGVIQQFTPRRLADGSTQVSTFWTAKTPTGMVPERTRSFSIDKYGEREAFRMAVAARQAFEALLPESLDA